jgi:hypothetical protein
MAKKVILDIHYKGEDRSGEQDCEICGEPIKMIFYGFSNTIIEGYGSGMEFIICPNCYKNLPNED